MPKHAHIWEVSKSYIHLSIYPFIHISIIECAQCQESIRSAQSLIALNRHWHLFCFSCARCKRYLTNEYMDK